MTATETQTGRKPLVLPDIDIHGPVACHNIPCAVCHTEYAVYDLNSGVFHPCWKCQNNGWKMVRTKNWSSNEFVDGVLRALLGSRKATT